MQGIIMKTFQRRRGSKGSITAASVTPPESQQKGSPLQSSAGTAGATDAKPALRNSNGSFFEADGDPYAFETEQSASIPITTVSRGVRVCMAYFPSDRKRERMAIT